MSEWAEAADDVHVGHTKSTRVVVLLPDAQKGLELRADSSLLKDLSDRSGALKRMKERGEKRWGYMDLMFVLFFKKKIFVKKTPVLYIYRTVW